MATLNYTDLQFLREKNPDKKIVFCSGSFDLTHAGHALFFEDCKKLGDVLVVAVGSDKGISDNKGPGRPILNEHVRIKMVDSLKPVNYSFLSHSTPNGKNWLYPIEEIFDSFKPDVWVVNNDGGDLDRIQEIATAYGVRLVILNRAAPPEYEGISTTSIIKKINGS